LRRNAAQQVEAMMKQIQGSTWRPRRSGQQLRNHSRPHDQENVSGRIRSIIRVNLTGTFIATRKSDVDLAKRRRIVNLSSVSGQMGLFGQGQLFFEQGRDHALTKVSARELARQNITVNAIAPGFIDVGMSKGMPDEVTETLRNNPLGRLGDVREIIDAALFLACRWPATSPVTCFNVNGAITWADVLSSVPLCTKQPDRR